MAAGTLRSLPSVGSTFWAGIVAALIGWSIAQTDTWRQIELALFDFLVVRTAPNAVSLPITIVGIDERSFEALDATWPLPRRHHARLLERLREANVAVVAFDVAFSGTTRPEDDAPFAAAIKAFGHVVLASDFEFREDDEVRKWFRVNPHPMFRAAGALTGHAALPVDDDAVLRRVPTMSDAFWRVVLEEFDRARPGIVVRRGASEDMRIRYLGGAHTFTYVPYHMLLDPDRYMPADWGDVLRDNIVLVGRNLNVIGEVGAAQAEMYQTPFFPKTREFMPRVEAHANLVANMAAGETLREAPDTWRHGAWALAVLAALALTSRWHPLRSGAALAGLIALIAAAEYAALAFQHLWLAAAGAMLSVALIYVSQGSVAYVAEQRQRRQLRDAFSMYVSPELVEEVTAHPERLKLGGERRQITILFSDLAGFTPIAELLDPEQVARLVNRHHTDMTDAIMAEAGMVQKFLGDGILAYFGAPVADERQSEHAVRAALAMQKCMAQISAELAGSTGAPLRIRIGINRGECIVGNMGSSRRFDYAAVGDPVNLASRLEGANKLYGTGILVSAAVAETAGQELRFREVDTLRVKGRQTGITVYTPCADEALIAASAGALAAYRSGNLDAAEAAWQGILAGLPGDPVASLFLTRIAALRKNGIPENWDGIAKLESK